MATLDPHMTPSPLGEDPAGVGGGAVRYFFAGAFEEFPKVRDMHQPVEILIAFLHIADLGRM